MGRAIGFRSRKKSTENSENSNFLLIFLKIFLKDFTEKKKIIQEFQDSLFIVEYIFLVSLKIVFGGSDLALTS